MNNSHHQICFSKYSWLPALFILLSSCTNGTSNDGANHARAGQYVKLIIAYRQDSVKVIDSIPIDINHFTAEDAMKSAAANNKLTYKSKAGQHGMIAAIDGYSADGGKKYWWMCINDTCASVSYEDAVTLPGSSVTWHYVADGKQPCKYCNTNN